MFSLGERICPVCQVLLPSGGTICVKCGRKVEPERTGISVVDRATAFHPWLVKKFGSIVGTIIAGVLIITFIVLAVGIRLAVKFWLRSAS